MYDPEAEAREWREDAKRDYRDAEKTIEDGNYIRACFYCHQAAEKIIKALYHFEGVTARLMREEFLKLKDLLWGDSFWSDSYFLASTGQVSLIVLKGYVEEQQSA